jgi:hypothetical protein
MEHVGIVVDDLAAATAFFWRGTNNEAIVPMAQPSAGALVRGACRS